MDKVELGKSEINLFPIGNMYIIKMVINLPEGQIVASDLVKVDLKVAKFYVAATPPKNTLGLNVGDEITILPEDYEIRCKLMWVEENEKSREKVKERLTKLDRTTRSMMASHEIAEYYLMPNYTESVMIVSQSNVAVPVR